MLSDPNVKRPFRIRARRALRRRWVQAAIVILVWLLGAALTYGRLAPKGVAAGSAKDTSKFKFMHCETCKMELPYNKDLDGKRCSKCQPPKEGFFVGTELSVKSGAGSMSPWTRVYVAIFVETFLMLGLMTYLMYREVPDPGTQYFVVACPYCSQRLRYRAASHGGLGSCSRCKRMIRFPEEHDAVTEAEVLAADEATARAEVEQARAEAEAEAEAQREGYGH